MNSLPCVVLDLPDGQGLESGSWPGWGCGTGWDCVASVAGVLGTTAAGEDLEDASVGEDLDNASAGDLWLLS